ncbi:MAG: glutamate--tRNA ligase [bacterium]|nr:glutamate--tRNA ligase [bacterium]
MVRVRFAPAPTGALHIGGARTALFNWLYAKHFGGKFILRIEDTDIVRSTNKWVKTILEELKWLGLDWDEGPYFQSDRLDIYKRYAERLVKEGKAYYCYCSREDLEKHRRKMQRLKRRSVYSGTCRELTPSQRKHYESQGRKPTVRFKIQHPGTTVVSDLIRGTSSFDNSILGDFIIIKSTGTPTYNFAVVVDDYEMGITHVIRGEDHISNTPRQILIYKALSVDPPKFAHLPLILGQDRTPLSKRHGEISITHYIENGYLPEALVNYLSLLGWGLTSSPQILSREELIKDFTLERVSKASAVFDIEKLLWINSEYIKRMDISRMTDICITYLKKVGLVEFNVKNSWFKEVIKLYKDRLKTISQIAEFASFFFEKEVNYSKEAINILNKEGTSQVLKKVKERFVEQEDFDVFSVEKTVRSLALELGIKAAKIIHPLRAALTGRTISPGIFDVVSLLGKERVINRIERALNLLKG